MLVRNAIAHLLSWIAICSVIAASPWSARSQTPSVPSYDCRNLSKEDAKKVIHDIVASRLKVLLNGVDYTKIVNTSWEQINGSARFGKLVDDSVATVQSRESWLDRAYSKFSKSSSDQYLNSVLDKFYGSSVYSELSTEATSNSLKEIESLILKDINELDTVEKFCLQKADPSVFSKNNMDKNGDEIFGFTEILLFLGLSPKEVRTFITTEMRVVREKAASNIYNKLKSYIFWRKAAAFSVILTVPYLAYEAFYLGDGTFPDIADQMKEETQNTLKKNITDNVKMLMEGRIEMLATETAIRISSTAKSDTGSNN